MLLLVVTCDCDDGFFEGDLLIGFSGEDLLIGFSGEDSLMACSHADRIALKFPSNIPLEIVIYKFLLGLS
jgi:hypothetical protein